MMVVLEAMRDAIGKSGTGKGERVKRQSNGAENKRKVAKLTLPPKLVGATFDCYCHIHIYIEIRRLQSGHFVCHDVLLFNYSLLEFFVV